MSSFLNYSRSYQDYLSFLDGGSKVPYHVDNVPYFTKPYNIDEEIELDNKIYMRSSNRYFVGIITSQLVRQIFASDFKLVESEISKNKLLNDDEKLVKKVQLKMDFFN